MRTRKRRATAEVRSASEAEILNRVRLDLGRAEDLVLWRNETGVAKHAGRTVRYGLCVGSADLIGIRTVTITPAMVGQRVGVFVAAELKTETGRPTPEQELFIALVERAGGLAGVCRSPAEVAELVGVPCP